MKKVFSCVLILCMVLSSSLVANAQSDSMYERAAYDATKAAEWENYTYSDEELADMKEAFSEANIQNAISKARTVSDGVQTIKLNDSFYLKIECEEVVSPSSQNTRASTTWWVMKRYHVSGENLLGMTLWDFYLDADFTYNGTSCSYIGSSAYGYTYGIGWSCSDFSSSGYNITSTNAKATGSGLFELHIGVDPVSVTVQSFYQTAYLYCTNNG